MAAPTPEERAHAAEEIVEDLLRSRRDTIRGMSENSDPDDFNNQDGWEKL